MPGVTRSAADAGPVVPHSSCWLEYFASAANAAAFAAQVEPPGTLIVPVVTTYDVFKKITRESGQDLALRAVAPMRRGQVVELDVSLALAAAVNALPMADSLIDATAQARRATLWTRQAHLDGLPGGRYFAKP